MDARTSDLVSKESLTRQLAVRGDKAYLAAELQCGCNRIAAGRQEIAIQDDILSVLAGTMYLCVPALILWQAVSRPAFRPVAASLLGSILPLTAVFIYMTIDFFVYQRSGGEAFGFYAMWIMGFAAYVASLLIGFGLGLLKWPRNLVGRGALTSLLICLISLAVMLLENA